MATTTVEIHESYSFVSEISTHFTETNQKSKDDLVENEDVLHTIYLVFLFITTIAGNLGKRLVDYASILPINNPEKIAFEPTLGFRIFVLILEIAVNLNAPYFSSSGYLYIINNGTSMELKRSVVLDEKAGGLNYF